MKVNYRGRLVEASELRTPDGETVIGYEIGGVGIVMPREVSVPLDQESGEVQPAPTNQAKSKRGADPSVK
jgi:hypothetical protein